MIVVLMGLTPGGSAEHPPRRESREEVRDGTSEGHSRSKRISRIADIEQCVETDMAAIGAPGAAVTVIHHGEVIFDRGFGYKREGEPL